MNEDNNNISIFKSSKRTSQIDKMVSTDTSNENFSNQLFIRLVAKGKKFTDVNFKYSIFDNCYLRNCTFESCDFTGCRFIGTNMMGSKFSGCKFDYSVFEKTIVDVEILESGMPGYENLKLRFARTLRINYQQLGDAKAANRAISVELDATEEHLRKAWKSNESYYRKEYPGMKRAKMFFEWFEFKTLDVIWGNGENLWKLSKLILFIFFFMFLFDKLIFGKIPYVRTLLNEPQIFFGVTSSVDYPGWYLTTIRITQLFIFGLFMSIIIKRLNRR